VLNVCVASTRCTPLQRGVQILAELLRFLAPAVPLNPILVLFLYPSRLTEITLIHLETAVTRMNGHGLPGRIGYVDAGRGVVELGKRDNLDA
jgi:hypothetical protein